MKVFISYVREDLGIAKKIYHDLKDAGLAPWMDMEDLLPGQTWEFEIDKAIEESSYFLILLSSNSVTKKGVVQKEVRKALEKFEERTPGETYIIPVRLDDCKPAYKELHALHWADIFPSYEHGFEKIRRALLQDQENRNSKPEHPKVVKNDDSTIVIDKPAKDDAVDKKFAPTNNKTDRTKKSAEPRKWVTAFVLALLIAGIGYAVIKSGIFDKPAAYSLTVKTIPSDAQVRIVEPKTEYQSGVRKLKPGTYQIAVTRDGFNPKNVKVEIENVDLELPVTLEEIRYALTIKPDPSDAKVLIVNPKTEYQPGIKTLKPGTYQIAVSRDGFRPAEDQIEISNKDVVRQIKLEEIRYALTIKPEPADAEVRIVKPLSEYQPGVMLKPGSYQFAVSRDGFEPKTDRVEIKNKDVEVAVRLEEIRYALTVKPDPSDAAVRIMNISESYKPGMRVKPGSYEIQVSKTGYIPFKEKKEITDSDLNLAVTLEMIQVQPPKLQLRSKPITVSDDEASKVFRLDEKSLGPLEYVKNDFKDNGGTITDHATGLMWQKSGSPNYMSYKEATAYIEKLNRKKFAGYRDWRLPTVDELKSLLTKEKQANGLYINPIFDETQWWCWTSDNRASGGAWVIVFSYGNVRLGNGSLYVRAVRLRQ